MLMDYSSANFDAFMLSSFAVSIKSFEWVIFESLLAATLPLRPLLEVFWGTMLAEGTK